MPIPYEYNNKSTPMFEQDIKENKKPSMQILSQSIHINNKITLELDINDDYWTRSIKGIKKALGFYQCAYNFITEELARNQEAFDRIEGLITVGCGFIEYYACDNSKIDESMQLVKNDNDVIKYLKELNSQPDKEIW